MGKLFLRDALVLQVLQQPLRELGVVHGAGLARNLFATTKNDQCWNAADLQAGTGLRRGIGVEFGEPNARFECGSGFFKDRRKLPTRPAPGRPAIDDDG